MEDAGSLGDGSIGGDIDGLPSVWFSGGVMMDWDKAKQHFDDVRKRYQELEGTPGVNTTLALRLTFDPLSIRYNNGERSQDLYDEMIAVE